MADRATAVHRARIAARIVGCAQTLAEERGLDGFTMDDVAARAGVSRRTLFNYVVGKLDAVLGLPAGPDPARFAEFRAGGPTGDLADDLTSTISAVLDAKRRPVEEWERMRALIASDARLHRAMTDRFAVLSDFLAGALLEREGERFSPLQARAAATVVAGLFDVALDAYVADPATTLAEYYLTAFDGAAALLGSSPTPHHHAPTGSEQR